MRPAFVLVALLCSLVALPASASGADRVALSGPRVTMFGDSVAESLAYVPEARRFLRERLDLQLHLASCRRLASPSCWYMGERPPTVLDIVQSSSLAQLGKIVVVDVGYNEPALNYEANMSVVAATLVSRGVEHVIWVTMREETDDYRQINRTIRAHAPRWPQVQVADWESASRGKDWFNTDGLHLNAPERSVWRPCSDPTSSPHVRRRVRVRARRPQKHRETCGRPSFEAHPSLDTF